MPVDFKQIKEGEDFELFCEDLLRARGFTIVQQSARGPEGGKDLIVSETVTDRVGVTEVRKTLVQCKHHAHSGKAVGFSEVANYRDVMDQYGVRRYLLITSTVPTEDLREKFEKTSEKGEYVASIWSRGDLARFLDAHLDVRDRHFPAPPGPTPADDLAQAVEGLLTVMGFTCQERQPAEDRVRLVCTSKAALTRPVAVVCKEGTVARDDVEALLAHVQAQGLGGGVLVTHTRVSPAARERATETGGLVRTFTLDEFYRELIDFEPYVRALVADYEGDELSTYYVDLGCRSGDGSAYKPMDDYVDRWLGDPARNHISMLGDYGTGKTSFCRQYAAKLGRRWLADPDHHRIPILISLRDYAKAVSLKQLVTDFLVNRYGIQAGYEAFRRFNADGKLLLLFDGFDEMAQKVDYQTTVDNFEELARAVEAHSKVLLTCRTPYFRTHREAEELLSRRRPEPLVEARDLHERAAIDLTERPNFEIVHLLPFGRQDIQAMLRARFPAEWPGYWQQIEDTYNLKELAQRPVLLDMIARSLPHLKKPGQALNAARLYEAYTDLWLLRDEEKGHTLITRTDRRLFMQELALEILRREELSIHFSRLPERVRAHFRLEKATEIDYFEHDIRTCSFLNRDEEGNYRFVHKSFGEFFVAQWLVPKLLDGSAPEMRINEEVRGFVRGLLAEGKWPPPPPPGVEVPEGMVWVPPGPFIMGGELGLPLQVARIAQGFFIARTPVTNSQYARFVAKTGHAPPRHWEGKTPPKQIARHPVTYVSWDDATAYAKRAGGRLPTEQEWEKAARGTDGREYPWGEWAEDYCNSMEAGTSGTTPVGQYSPQGDSPYGCADMAGNVWEWTASEYKPGSGERVVRGGSWDDDQRGGRCVSRIRNRPYRSDDNMGMRVVVSRAPG
jgi:formylglycine-generating enzyme required for sulfatase activity/Holliday junction resolvase-like predicted endonuclease